MLRTPEIIKYSRQILSDLSSYSQVELTLRTMIIDSLPKLQKKLLHEIWRLEFCTVRELVDNLHLKNNNIYNALNKLEEYNLIDIIPNSKTGLQFYKEKKL